MNFTKTLNAYQRRTNSLLCIGLDTDPKKIPLHLRSRINGVLEFNKAIINATMDIACAYKINFAFYEALGKEGWSIIEKTLAAIPSSVFTIADAKRGDIGNSSGYYADAILNVMDFDSITVAPYMGKDSVLPFLKMKNKGVFLLALTSNAGANDFQYTKSGGKRLFENVVSTSLPWDRHRNLGFVVGATKAADLRTVRALAPDSYFLVPGVGAQGGRVGEVIQYGCTKDGLGVIINSSRSIIYASSGKDFADAARSEALKLNNEINFFRDKYF